MISATLSRRRVSNVDRPTDATRPKSWGVNLTPDSSIIEPFVISSPIKRRFSPEFAVFRISTLLPVTRQFSCIATQSAPSGRGAPVKIRAASPLSNLVPTLPAIIRCEMYSVTGKNFTSSLRRAYPSIALFVCGGTSNGAMKSSANTRPTQSVRGVDSISSIAGRLFRRIEIASSMGVKFFIILLKSPPHLFR